MKRLLSTALLAGLTVLPTAAVSRPVPAAVPAAAPHPLVADAAACMPEASCTSAAKVASEIYPQYAKAARSLGCTIVTVQTGGQVPEDKCLQSAAKMEQLGRSMVAFWNNMVNNSWATVGPRRWDVKPSSSAVSHSGTIQALGTRLFVQEAPITSRRVSVSLRKVDGNGTVTVTVCASKPGGQPTVLWTFNVDAADRDGALWSREFSGVQGKVLSVHLVGKTPLRKMQYRVRGVAL